MFYEGMLPDFSNWIDTVTFPNTRKPEVHNNSARTQEFMRMLSLFMQRTSVSQLKIETHLELCEANPAYKRLVSIILEVSMLGAYKHSDYCPRFNQCVDIHQLCHRSHNTPQFDAWQKTYGDVVLMAMREFVIFQVRNLFAYNQYLMAMHPWWIDHSKQICASMNIVRLSIARGNTLPGTLEVLRYLLVDNYFDTNVKHQDILRIVNERYSGVFDNVTTMSTRYQPDIDYLFYLCKHLMVVNAALSNYNRKRTKLPREIIKSIEYFVQAIPRHTPLDLNWLLVFNWGKKESRGEPVNICEHTIFILTCCLNFIEHRQFRWVVDALFLINVRDYEFVDAFFFNLYTHYSITVHPLCVEIAKKQAEAVARRNRTDLIPSASPWIASIAWAPCCGVMRSYLAQNVTSHTLGVELVGINTATGEACCKNKDPFSLQKRAAKHASKLINELHEALEKDKNDVRLEKICQRIKDNIVEPRQKRFFAQSDCTDTPLVAIPEIGFVVQITSPRILYTSEAGPITNSFTKCTQCAATTNFSRRMFRHNGFICGECDIPHTKAFDTPVCIANGERIKLNVPQHWYWAVDDRPEVGDYRLKIFYVCDHCFLIKTAKYEDFQRFPFASDLRRCRLFDKNRMHSALAFDMHQPVSHLYHDAKSNFGAKIHAANKRKRKN